MDNQGPTVYYREFCSVLCGSLVGRGVCGRMWKSLSLVWFFCDPMDYTVHGILQARILEWVAFPFSTQGLNPGLLHCRWILYQLSHKGSPGILEWVADPFSRGSSLPRNQTGVSCIAGGFFTNWVMREAVKFVGSRKIIRSRRKVKHCGRLLFFPF